MEIILIGGEQADEAMYYLLHKRLYGSLRKKYEQFQSQLLDGFDDIVEDFFLYLREGKDGQNDVAYQSLRRIQKREAFESWMLNTFRNYLTARVTTEDGRMVGLSDDQNIQISDNSNLLTNERKLAIASQLIAYAHQEFPPRDCFILLRSLLSMLNKQQAMPNDEMAKALGMTDISYRVTTHRIKCRLAKCRELMLQGVNLHLDGQHRLMAKRINDDFDHLYPTLMIYYGQTLEMLNRATAVKQLQQEYLDATGNLLHEPEAPYLFAPPISVFWKQFNRFLIT